MALSWSMDKLGPMCRSVEDCAIVFEYIYGPDDRDNSVIDVPFAWNTFSGIKKLKIGYLKTRFEREIEMPEDADENRKNRVKRQREQQKLDNAALKVMRGLDVELIPVNVNINASDMNFILSTESAAAFEELTLSNRDDLLERSSRPQQLRLRRFVPAVDFIQANRARTLIMQQMDEAIKDVDVFIEPTFSNSLLTNLTGHPAVVVPNGFIDGTPGSISFIGKLFNDTETLAVAKAYQDATDHHLKYPKL